MYQGPPSLLFSVNPMRRKQMPGLNGTTDISAQRRTHVAVLFADLSGFSGLVESVDPETVYATVRPIMDESVTLVDAYGGDIQQVLGDGFMAVFGLRTESGGLADNDALRAVAGSDALRAVRVGMALAAATANKPGRLPVHVGIECGEVLVSPSWKPAGFAVWGRAVTVASRLCDLAGPGNIHIGPRTFELVGPDIGYTPPVRARLKGTRGHVLVRRVTSCPERILALAG
jgi:class 3 adenylate cyclase